MKWKQKNWLRVQLNRKGDTCAECKGLPWECSCSRMPMDLATWLCKIALIARRDALKVKP